MQSGSASTFSMHQTNTQNSLFYVWAQDMKWVVSSKRPTRQIVAPDSSWRVEASETERQSSGSRSDQLGQPRDDPPTTIHHGSPKNEAHIEIGQDGTPAEPQQSL